jgi:hypothetical protein
MVFETNVTLARRAPITTWVYMLIHVMPMPAWPVEADLTAQN